MEEAESVLLHGRQPRQEPLAAIIPKVGMMSYPY